MPPYEKINIHPATHPFTSLSSTTYDVICIGSGWAGRTIAARVVKAGLSAIVVESELVGGDCPFWACVPSKVLLRSGEALKEANAVGGVREPLANGKLDAEAVFKRRDTFTAGWDDRKLLIPMVESSGASLVRGRARIAGVKQVAVDSTDGQTLLLEARYAVALCTGSEPIIPDIPGLHEAQPWTPRHATSSSHAPEHLIIIGAGAVGCEMATAYASFGSKVTLISSSSGILPKLDVEAASVVQKGLESDGVQVYLSTKVVKVEKTAAGSVEVKLSDGTTIKGSQILVAAGRKAQTSNLGLEKLNILTDGAPIPVNESLQVKAVPEGWLYAAGDVNGRAPLTHSSKYHGRIASNAILARVKGSSTKATAWNNISATADILALPQVIFTSPTVASVGLTKKGAEAAGRSVRVITTTSATIASRVHADGYEDGWAQWVIDEKSQVLLGATFVDSNAAELLHASTVAVVGGLTLETLQHAVPSFPTLSEVYLNLLEAAGL
ncbi:hypothetical protein V490_03345 [Pseudogymnoascus sp. VKM F-3557]|nr:hypothetical protein V490_03345 [Pseudogymnoascus sp. VKM F-3557]